MHKTQRHLGQQIEPYDKIAAYYFIRKTGFMFMENRSIVSNKYHLSLWRHGTTSSHYIKLSKARRMSGVQDIKLIANTSVFSIISICLTMYCDVEAHGPTSSPRLKTPAYLQYWADKMANQISFSKWIFGVWISYQNPII